MTPRTEGWLLLCHIQTDCVTTCDKLEQFWQPGTVVPPQMRALHACSAEL
jgi:hypothetical protein